MPQGESTSKANATTSREVTDPITHLPITIHDNTSEELGSVRLPPAASSPQRQPKDEGERAEDSERRHDTVQRLVDKEGRENWADPQSTERRRKIESFLTALASGGAGVLGGLVLAASFARGRYTFLATAACLASVLATGVYALLHRPLDVGAVQDAYNHEKQPVDEDTKERPESAAWLNSLLHSLWPIVNPDLFTSISDMLEDAMQASLPRMVHGVRVVDLGQGAEPMRILGLRWLDPGDATVEKPGMTAEQGDFVNLEVAFAYRSRPTKKGMRERAQNAHLLIEFWTVANIRIPVWVEVTGILATARLRLQLTPNPPFLSEMTMSLLGQPKVTMAATPLSKGFVNVMDIPGLSKWLQESIDSAVSAYVAPRSLTLDLKTMLTGAEKRDTDAVGLLIVVIKRASGLKSGDEGKVLASKDSKRGDVYVTISWAKWGKPLWASRIINEEPQPTWEETAGVIVGQPELNAQERLRLQIWDSDRLTADDSLGTVEVSLYDLMHSPSTKNRMSNREDKVTDVDGTPWPGTLSWSVGYFGKIDLHEHLADRPDEVAQIKKDVDAQAERKLREAKVRNESNEIEQQKDQDLKEKTDEIFANTPPNSEWPSGVLRVWIEQIHGLETVKIKESGVSETEDEGADDLPSAYCTIMINHQRLYKTRTKIKSNRPYYSAGTERFVRDWRTTSVFVAVRDARTHENDPLLGIVVLPLRDLFKERSQVSDFFPLVGGIGFGRIQLSIMFRSAKVSLPRELLGWDVGTLEIRSDVKPSEHFPPELMTCRLITQTEYGKGKLRPEHTGCWTPKHGRPIRLAVQKRYASNLMLLFRKNSPGRDRTSAFSSLWFKDIPDDEEVTITVPVCRNTDGAFDRARLNASDEFGERVGEVTLTVRFWPGLSGYHKAAASKDLNARDVMEVLDCAEESREITQEQVDGGQYASSSESDSDSSSSDGEDQDENAESQQHTGVIGEIKDFKERKGALHRKHRGLMQWHGMRQLAWAKREVGDKAEHLKDKLTGFSPHNQRAPGIDTEV
ncbi:hypothetical protein PLICRDRAFT_172066 [Plicaturopsis crispa FD-325 SS-3]|nr:hypothetical protein PLICRDRAFT_172066 [Plicaturopsis crispa FD-325 SS-3]